MKIILTGIINQENEQYLAYCPELEVDSIGKSVEEAKHNLEDAIDLYFQTAKEAGIFKQIVEKLKKKPATQQRVYREVRENDYVSNLTPDLVPA